MSRSAWFLGLAAVLAGQAAFIDRVDEPFPAITMPAFRGSGGHRGERLRRTDCAVAFGFADGRVMAVPQRELLAPYLPIGRHNEAMRLLCGIGRRPQLPDWIRERFPSYRRGRRYRADPAGTAWLREWAFDAARRVTGDVEPVWIELRRVELRIAPGPDGLDTSRRVLETERIALVP